MPGEPPVHDRRGGDGVGHERGEHEPDLADVVLLPQRRRGRAEHRHGVVPGRADDPDVAAGGRRQRDRGRGCPPRSCTARRRRAARRRCAAGPAGARRGRVRGCRRTAAALRAPPTPARRACAGPRPRSPSRWRPGCGRSRCRARCPDSWFSTACQRGRCSGGVVALGEHPAGPGQRRCAARTARRSPGGPRTPRCRRRPGWPAPGGCPASGRGGRGPPAGRAASLVTASLLAEQHLELVDHRDDPRPAPVRVVEPRSSSSLVTSCRLGRLGPAAHLVGEVLQQRQPELAVGVDVDADQARVRQPGRVPTARGELRERHALLEVEQVELQLVRASSGRPASAIIVSSRFVLPEPLGPPTSACGRGVGERHLDRHPLGEADRRAQPGHRTASGPTAGPAGAGRGRCRPACASARARRRSRGRSR